MQTAPASRFLNALPADPQAVRILLTGVNLHRSYLTGPEAVVMMRLAGTTIAGVAKQYGLTQKRVREVRAMGVSGYFGTCEWIANLCGNNQCFSATHHAALERGKAKILARIAEARAVRSVPQAA